VNKLYIALLLLLVFSCKQTPKHTPFSKAPLTKYAGFFSFEKHNDFSLLRIRPTTSASDNEQVYVLSRSYNNVPDSLKSISFIKIPVKNMVVTSTTHLPALTMLQEENALSGFPGTRYISSPSIRKKIEENKIKETGFQGQLNIETILNLQPELLMLSAGAENQNIELLKKNGIPVLYNADWLESTPLGRAEWIKVFGLLFDKSRQADSIFKDIEKKYLSVQQAVKTQANKPVVFQGGKFGDKWYVPGGKSYAVKLIQDAGGKYSWDDDKHTGSIGLNYENVLMKLPHADIWLNPGMYNTRLALQKNIPEIQKIPAFKTHKIYTYNLKKGSTGGVLYFEYSNAHPDWVLEDLYHIFYPQAQAYSFHFYERLP